MPSFLQRLGRKAQYLQFALAGIAGLCVDVGSMYGFSRLGWPDAPARFCAFLLAVICTWQINRRTTFAAPGSTQQAAAASPGLLREFALYLLAMLGGGAINLACSLALLWYLPPHGLRPLLAIGAGSLAGMVFNFCAAKWFVFRQSH